MKLHIENFAKISTADILLDGLTVVAGDNNTGKSTVGKVLYAFFRSISNLDKRIQSERMNSLRRAFAIVPGADNFGDVVPFLLKGTKPESLVADILNSFWELGAKIGAPRPTPTEIETAKAMYTDSVRTEIDKALHTSDTDYANRILLRVFDCVFHQQYHPLQSNEGVARLELTVQNQKNVIEFGHDAWRHKWPTRLIKKARLIATPDILSLVNVPNIESDKNAVNYFDKYTFEILKELRQESLLSTSRQIDSEKSLEAIFRRLDAVIGGTFKRDDQNDLALFETGHTRPTKAANLSMGLKAFVLLRCMLEKGVLSEKDVLILDEPENHLHPEWQVVYAQLLVLLQKTFDLTMMVTTHSNFFVNALQRFSISENIVPKTHFYLSQADAERPGFYTFGDKKGSSSAIMRSFNTAYDSIDAISGGAS